LFLDRNRERFELHGYALNADDGSRIRAEMASGADRFVDVSSWATEDIIRRMQADQLDVLVDNSGFFAGTRPEVLAARVAPVQAGFVGISCTLGPGLLDYRISDALTTPVQAQSDWFEKLVLVPAPHWIYDADQPVGPAGARVAHGLPATGFVFCCFNQSFKMGPDIFGVWMRLLLQNQDSVLWLLDGGELVRTNLSREAQRAGVALSRLVFAPRIDLAAHLGRMKHADLFLDTLHYGAHTTAADALYAGVPVLTCAGGSMASRLAATFSRCAGLPDLVVDDLAGYELKARELAADPDALAAVKTRLSAARNHAPFFAIRDRLHALERAFIAMVERSRAGLPPDTLIIE
jgi:predicted O-linked N-acetylglucosamine transferase (SPINDLY family)